MRKDLDDIKSAINDKLKIYKSEEIPVYKELDGDYYPVLEKCENEGQLYERFCRDALYLKDYVYSNPDFMGSEQRHPIRSFCDMTIGNLRTYIMWRTYIRRWIYIETNKAYVSIYINELLNLIGVSEKEALEKLIFLWNKSSRIPDNEFLTIIKDFCIMYNPTSFKIVMSKCEKYRPESYIEDRIYEGDFTGCLPYLDQRSAQHKIIGSSFYETENGRVLDFLVPVVMEEVAKYYKEIGYDFGAMLFTVTDHPYTLFKNNPFVKPKEIKETYYVANHEYYFMKGDELHVCTLKPNNIHNRMISYILKLTESRVRELLTGRGIKIYRPILYADQYRFFDTFVSDELEERIIKVVDLYLNSNVDEKELAKVSNNNFDNILKQMQMLSFTESGRLFGNSLFFKQMVLFENFEYNVETEYEHFVNVTPSYSTMTVDMLKSYFSFRTKVRKSIFEKADIGYVKLYINEIFLLCGCRDKMDALVKLTDFWQGMRPFVKNLDSLMESVIKDFYLYHNIDIPYSDVWDLFPKDYITDTRLNEEILKGNYSNLYLLLIRRLDTKITKEYQPMLRSFFPKLAANLNEYLKGGNCNISMLLYGEVLNTYYKFNSARLILQDKPAFKPRTSLSEYEQYIYDNNNLYVSANIVGDREILFTEYMLDVTMKLIKGETPQIYLVFCDTESYSYHAQLIESYAFIDVFRKTLEETGARFGTKKKSLKKLSVWSLGDKVIRYNKDICGDITYMKKYIDDKIGGLNNRTAFYNFFDRLFYAYSYNRNYSQVCFLIKAKLLEDVDSDKAVIYHEDEDSYLRSIYEFESMKAFEAYLYWRTNVRRGNVLYYSKRFVLYYLSEIVNLIGFKTQEDAFKALFDFWYSCRRYDSLFEETVRDFFLFYDIDGSYEEVRQLFPKDYSYSEAAIYDVYKGKYEAAGQYVLTKSPYKYSNSAFALSENGYLMKECMPLVLKQLDRLMREYDLSLPYFVLGAKDHYSHTLFEELKFLPLNKYKDFVKLNDHDAYIIDSHAEYTRVNNHFDTVSQEFAGIVTKLTEIALRDALNYRGALKSPLIIKNSTNDIIVDLINIVGADKITACVNSSVRYIIKSKGFFVNEEKEIIRVKPIRVEVDFSKLDEIRKVSDELCDKLVIDEEEISEKEKPKIIKKESKQAVNYDTIKVSPWGAFSASLSELHVKVLKGILQNEDINVIARCSFVLPEVIIEEINEIALSCIGDSVIDTDGTIIEDYRDEILNNIDEKQEDK